MKDATPYKAAKAKQTLAWMAEQPAIHNRFFYAQLIHASSAPGFVNHGLAQPRSQKKKNIKRWLRCLRRAWRNAPPRTEVVI